MKSAINMKCASITQPNKCDYNPFMEDPITSIIIGDIQFRLPKPCYSITELNDILNEISLH